MELTQSYLISILLYNNGKLYWKKNNKLAGYLNKKSGYFSIKINQKIYRLHNIIWKMLTGNNPVGEIDHIEKATPMDNRIENLRDVTHKENCKNRCKRKNKSGYSNITILTKGIKRFVVQFRSDNYQKAFLTLEEAIQNRDEKYIEFGYHENHGK